MTASGDDVMVMNEHWRGADVGAVEARNAVPPKTLGGSSAGASGKFLREHMQLPS